MSKAQMDLIRQGLEAGDPKELVDQLYSYCIAASTQILTAYHIGKDMLERRKPTEKEMEYIRDTCKKASENMLDAAEMFEPDCMLDLLDCED